MRKSIYPILAGLLGLILSAGTANAAVLTIEAAVGLVGGSGDVENVLFDNAQDVTFPAGPLDLNATPILGFLNQSGEQVNIWGHEGERFLTTASGQATVNPVDGGFDFLYLEFDDPLVFAKVQIDVGMLNDAVGTLTLKLESTIPGADYIGNFDIGGANGINPSGVNWFTGWSDPSYPEFIKSVTLSSDDLEFTELTHVRMGAPGTPIPEPATMLLFGVGLAGLAGTRIRRKR